MYYPHDRFGRSHPYTGPFIIRRNFKQYNKTYTFNVLNDVMSSAATLPKINIIGLKKLYDSSYTTIGKCFWFTSLIASLVICIVHVSTRIHYYLQNPVTTDVRMVQTETVIFPGIVLCPTYLRKYLYELSASGFSANPTSIIERVEKENISSTLSTIELWNRAFKIDRRDIQVYVPCEDERDCHLKEGKKIDLKHESVEMFTVWGKCLSLNYVKPMVLRGSHTFLKIKRRSKTSDEEGLLYLFFENNIAVPRHKIFDFVNEIPENDSRILRIKYKKFILLNSKENPCTDFVTYRNCRNECFDKVLAKSLPCRMPYVYRNIKEDCANITSAYEAFLSSYYLYSAFDRFNCNCLCSCHRDVVSVKKMAGESEAGYTILQINFLEGIHELITESYIYFFAALLSDIGGSVGIFLGCCSLTVLEIIEYFYDKLISKVK